MIKSGEAPLKNREAAELLYLKPNCKGYKVGNTL